jgi:molybdopterin-binding protein
MKTGARNEIKGKVTEIKRGTVMCQVKVQVTSEPVMSSVMTLESLDNLGLKEGDEVTVVAKAVNVLLIKE